MKAFRIENLFLLGALMVIFLVGGLVLVREEVPWSKAENRELNHFEHFTIEGFVDGSFQDNFELALSDQFWGSEQIRLSYAQVTSHLPTFGIEENVCEGRYIGLASSDERKRGTFDCEDYIMYMPDALTDEKKAIVEENITKYNHVNKLTKAYYYFVDDSSSFDFRVGKKVNDYYGMLESELIGEEGLERLEFDDYEGYKKYFYKNDHHWDYRGSYQGFVDIAKMMGVREPMRAGDTFTNHEDFFGSYARLTSNYDYPEEFVFYDFELPEHDVLINGKADKYNHFEEYKKHEYEYEKTMNYYAYVYGDDFAEIEFDYHQPGKGNLLIISNSYSNAINELVAQYFDKTYVVDLRQYKEVVGEDFVLSDYLKQKKIDKTLILMSPTFIWAAEPNRGLEL